MLRRGRPTIHVRFGEDVAILAAISLLSRAFGLVASAPGVPADARTRMSSTLANAIGTKGLAMGQYQDLRAGRDQRSTDDIAVTNELKTGMLFDVAVNMATVIAESGDSVVLPLKRFARAAGQAFQIRDDLQDGPGNDSAVTGKDVGLDAGKATIVLTLGVEEAQRQLAFLVQESDRHLVGALGEQAATRLFIRALFAEKAVAAPRINSVTAPVAVRGAAFVTG
jgi:geranylgeranyl diphosphate synthase type II